MKRFASTFLAVLIVVESFLALGGYAMFFSRPYLTGALCALMIAAIVHTFIVQQEAIEQLKKQVQELQKEKEL